MGRAITIFVATLLLLPIPFAQAAPSDDDTWIHAISRQGTALVSSMDVSPDGSLLALGDWSNDVTIRHTSTYSQEIVLSEHTYAVKDVEFSPNGSYLASAGMDSNVFIWNTTTWQREYHIIVTGYALSVSYNPNGSLLAIGTTNYDAVVYDTSTWAQHTPPLVTPGYYVNSIAFSNDGSRLAVGSGNQGKFGIDFYNVNDWYNSTFVGQHNSDIYGLSWSPDDEFLAFASNDGSGTVWNTSFWTQTLFHQFASSLTSVLFTNSGSEIIFAGTDDLLEVYDTSNWIFIQDLTTLSNREVTALALQIDDNLLYSSHEQSVVNEWLHDADSDGISNLDDICPNTPLTAPVDSEGCSAGQADDDDDGVRNDLDPFPNDATQWQDNDQDGFGENPNGTNPDQCPDSPLGEIALVDEFGCTPSQRDTDQDGVNDALDQCSNTSPLENANAEGCGESQRDSDADGITDDIDECQPSDTQWASSTTTDVDGDGCRDETEDDDDDSDSILDADDSCPRGMTNWISDAQNDFDQDGCNDAAEDLDDDDDGVYDTLDSCPRGWGNSSEDRVGCIDSDGDGWSDADSVWLAHPNGTADAFPNDPLKHLEEVETTDTEDNNQSSSGNGDETPEIKDQEGIDLDLVGVILAIMFPIIGIGFTLIVRTRKKNVMKRLVDGLEEQPNLQALNHFFETVIEPAALDERISMNMLAVLKKHHERLSEVLTDGIIDAEEREQLYDARLKLDVAMADHHIDDTELEMLTREAKPTDDESQQEW